MLDLFSNYVTPTINTQGIKYTGSKLKLLPYILASIKDLPIQNILDGFSGTTRVSQAFAKMGYHVTANDISYWSETFGKCFLQADADGSYYSELINHLNKVKSKDGWFSENYGGSEFFTGFKRPFQKKNAQKLDGIREEIDRLNLNEIDKSVALTSLILALDKVDSTLGHYVSYLKEWSLRSFNDLELTVPKIIKSNMRHKIVRGDIFETLSKNKFDLCYFDPPYGSSNEKMPPSRVRYGSYYHIWKTVILNDRPDVFGKANRRTDTRDTVSSSVFEEFRRDESGNFIAMNAIEKMIHKANTKYILLSYSSGGRGN